ADFMKNSIFQKQKNTSHNRIGLLATTGTIKTEVYQKRLEKVDLEITIPDEKSQDEIMEIIYRIKEKGNSKEIRNEILEIVDHFRKNNNLNWVILGCTELPLPFQEKQDFNDLKLINPMQILAEKVVGIIKKGITL
ncbi:MAG: aspartate/glutamate racemase family protein, partial [archaeon]|nr:aspartate/glutamate racemase family protein [archaeon]